MSAHEFMGLDDLIVERDEGTGEVLFIVVSDEGDRVMFRMERFYDQAEDLLRQLKAATGAAESLVRTWEDMPEEDDNWVTFDSGKYRVNVGGSFVGEFPTQDIAEYEVARQMVDDGVFSNSWYSNERGNYFSIDESVRKYHDEGGDGLLPLEGVRFEEGDVAIRDADAGVYVAKDYGALGITWTYIGDDTVHFSENPDELRKPVADDNLCMECGQVGCGCNPYDPEED